MTRRERKRLALLGFAALAALAACRDARDRLAEEIGEKVIAGSGREAKVKVDREHGSVTIDLGRAIAPKGWPDEVPIYPGAERAKIEGRDAGVRRLAVTTSDSVPALSDFYRKELASRGWRVSGSGGEFEAERGSTRLRLSFASRGEWFGSVAKIEVRGAG